MQVVCRQMHRPKICWSVGDSNCFSQQEERRSGDSDEDERKSSVDDDDNRQSDDEDGTCDRTDV